MGLMDELLSISATSVFLNLNIHLHELRFTNLNKKRDKKET